MEPGPDADLDGVGAGVDQRLGALAGGRLAADDVHMGGGRILLEPGDHVQHALAVAVGGVHHQHVDAGLDQGHGTLVAVAEEADGGADAQPAFVVLGGSGYCSALSKSLTVMRPVQDAVVVDQRQLLDAVLAQQVRSTSSRLMPTLPVISGIVVIDVVHLGGRVVGVGHKAGVAVGDDAQQLPVGVDHRQAGDPVVARRARRVRPAWRPG